MIRHCISSSSILPKKLDDTSGASADFLKTDMNVTRRKYHSLHELHSRKRAFAITALLLLSGFVSAHQVDQVKRGRQKHELQQREYMVFEKKQTEKLLGIGLQDFPGPQGPSGWDDLPTIRPVFRFSKLERSPTGPGPRPSYEVRSIVSAEAPDGSVYEAYSGRDEYELSPDHGFAATYENRRQMYGTHHGYSFNPQNVFIGKRVEGRIKPTLFFRDVGSHDTAPHHLAIDNKGMAHLIVADVNIFQDNRLDLYWVIGDPVTGKWITAWQIDRRGFTSWSHPWSAMWADKVNVLWNWCDESINKNAPGMGIFFLQWHPAGFSRKVRVVKGTPRSWDAAVDKKSGRLLLVYANEAGVFVTSRPEGGLWTRPALLKHQPREDVSVKSNDDGSFIIRTGSEDTREWVVRPR